MSHAWQSGDEPALKRPRGALAWARVVRRGGAMALVTFGGLGLLLLLRLVERPLHGADRPLTARLVKAVCRANLAVLGVRLRVEGTPMAGPGAFVANHGSWMDIFVLGAAHTVTFVSKAEVAGWPGIGWLARATGTLFITRDPREAAAQKRLLEARLRADPPLLFFPEGTSTDTRRVLPFKTTLFEAFFAPDLRDRVAVQPVSVVYRAPEGRDARFYGWWGGMEFGPHLMQMLAEPRHGGAEVVFHPPLKPGDFAGRKQLTARAETAVRAGHDSRLPAGA